MLVPVMGAAPSKTEFAIVLMDLQLLIVLKGCAFLGLLGLITQSESTTPITWQNVPTEGYVTERSEHAPVIQVMKGKHVRGKHVQIIALTMENANLCNILLH